MNITKRDSSLDAQLEQLLKHQTPQTRDQETLNVQSRRQLADATYRVDELPSRTSDANHLVPERVSRDQQEGTWRYPPHVETSLLIKKSSLDEAALDIQGGFHRGSFLMYHETRDNYTGRITSSPDIDVPDDFSTIEIAGSEVTLLTQSENGFQFEDKSAPLQGYKFSLGSRIDLEELWENDTTFTSTSTLPAENIPIKLYDEEEESVVTAAIDDQGEIEEPVAIDSYKQSSKRAAYITLKRGGLETAIEVDVEDSTAYPDCVRVRVRLINRGGSSISNSYRLQEKAQSLFNPFLQLEFSESNIKFPSQQHADAISDAVEGRDEVSQQDREGFEAVYTQVNGTLTQSVIDSEAFLLTTYGVYDYLREVPKEAYSITKLIDSTEALVQHFDGLSEEEQSIVKDSDELLELARKVLAAVPAGFDLSTDDSLYAFQWEAIQQRLAILATDAQETTVLKAPTGSGKTLPFLVNAALTALYQDTRVVLAFPTRLLNEDMSKRVMRFTYALRTTLNRDDITAGLLVGQSDPLYGSLSEIDEGDSLAQYDRCPACGERGEIVASKPANRVIGHCEACDHDIDYVYHPREAISYLPTFTVATPDKLFYEATVRGYESQPYGKFPFFGGTYLSCQKCGAAASVMNPRSDTKSITCPECRADIPHRESDYEYSPIGHWVFDEVHSLHDLTGTILSIFLELPNLLYSKIQDHDYHADGYCFEPTFETGTATIGNETELLSAVTRTDESNIRSIPETEDYREFFSVDENSTRYRVLAILPVGTSNRQSVRRALLGAYEATHHDDDYRSELQTSLDSADRGGTISAYEFLLGYVYKKSDGRALQTSIGDDSSERLSESLSPPFLSGNTSSGEMSKLFEQAQEGELSMLLANLVVSLGVDIENLNQMIMLGAPKQMTEQVQTAGRTGRGDVPGHVTIHLLPSNPRDVYLYTNFHRVMSDIEGYYETYPIQSTNAHAAELLLPNLLKAVLAGLSYEEFALTTHTAARALSNNTRNQEIQADLLRLLRTENTDQALVQEIYDTISDALGSYAHEWGRLDDSQYLSQWFQNQSEMMYSLRKSSSRHVDVSIEEDSVLDEIRQDYSVSTS